MAQTYFRKELILLCAYSGQAEVCFQACNPALLGKIFADLDYDWARIG